MRHVIQSFTPAGGKHCVSNSIKQIFHYYNHLISEEMLLGLAAGLNFIYFDIKFNPYPLIGGRNKLMEFEENLAAALNIRIEVNETASGKKAYGELKQRIAADIPVVLYVDMAELSYLGLPDDAHFGGHSIVVFGIDEEEQVAYISDRDAKGFKVTVNENEIPADYHIVPLSELAKARGSKAKPYPPKNKWLTFDFAGMKPIDNTMVTMAICKNLDFILHPPMKNLGVAGIRLFAEKLVTDWKGFDADKLKGSAFNAFIFINEKGGNGGGIFRKMYGDFLIEASDICRSDLLHDYGTRLKVIGEEWDQVGYKLLDIYEKERADLLDEIAGDVNGLYDQELELFTSLYVRINS